MRRPSFALIATAMLLAACGGEPAPPLAQTAPLAPPPAASAMLVSAVPGDTFARAATVAAEQRGYRYTFEIAVRGIPDVPGGTFALGGAGSVDQPAGRSSVRLDLRGLRQLLLASGDLTAAELDSYLGDGTLEFIQDRDTYYLRMPFLAASRDASTPWVSVTAPAGGAGDFGLGGFGAVGGMGGFGNPSNPAAYLDHLKAIDGTITVVGTEQVRGVSTTHYRGAFDLARLLGSAAPAPEELAELDAALAAFAQVSPPYDVWIDADGLPRRLATTLDFSAFAPVLGGGGPSGPTAPSLMFSYELFDFGNPEPIDLPAPSEVTPFDLAELESGSLGF